MLGEVFYFKPKAWGVGGASCQKNPVETLCLTRRSHHAKIKSMPAEITNELIYEVLKQLQGEVADIRRVLADHSRQFILVRQDINGLRGDDLRREAIQAQMDVRLERIETRLNISDTPH